MSSASSKIGFHRYLSYQPPSDDEDAAPDMLPASHRNRFIYFNVNDRSQDRKDLLCHIFAPDHQPSTSVTLQGEAAIDAATDTNGDAIPVTMADDNEFHPPVRKTRRVTQRVIKITKQLLRDQIPHAPNKSVQRLNTYQNFKVKTVEVGVVVWRLHTQEQEYVIFNDYTEGGELIPNSFAEVVFTHQAEGGYCVCTCAVYKVIACIASSQQSQGEEGLLPDGILCMHCRFFKEEMLPFLKVLMTDATAAASTALEDKLRMSKTYLNDPIVKLTDGPGTQKYSVRPITSTICAIVHVAASGIMAMCTRGICQAAQRHKRSVKRLLELDDASSLCEHLGTMHANRELWAPQEPPEDIEEEQEEQEGDDTDAPDVEDINGPEVDRQEAEQPAAFQQVCNNYKGNNN